MSITRTNPLLPEAGGATPVRSATAPAGGDFAAVARSIAAGDLAAAQKALAASGAPAAGSAQTLAQTLAEGNLAAARLALAQLGADPFDTHAVGASGPDVRLAPAPPSGPDVHLEPTLPSGPNVRLDPTAPAPSPSVPGTASNPFPVPDTKILGASATARSGMVVADVGATLATGSMPVATPGPTVQSTNGKTFAVADVMLALALGNAGDIPPDVINLYGPGGARYDPAAIMDAYRNSDLGRAQIAALSWVGRPA